MPLHHQRARKKLCWDVLKHRVAGEEQMPQGKWESFIEIQAGWESGCFHQRYLGRGSMSG